MEVMTGLHKNVNDQIFHPATFPVTFYAVTIIQQSRIMKVVMVLASSFIWEYGPKYDFETRECRGLVFITTVTRTKSIHNLPFSVVGC